MSFGVGGKLHMLPSQLFLTCMLYTAVYRAEACGAHRIEGMRFLRPPPPRQVAHRLGKKVTG